MTYSLLIDGLFMVYFIPNEEITDSLRGHLGKAHNFSDRDSVCVIAQICLTQWTPYLSDFREVIQVSITHIYRIPTMIAHSRLEMWSQ
jgi:hypothetical protein